MFADAFNRGFIFNNFPRLFLASTRQVESDSDLLVKISRLMKQDENITHDHQIFRDYRNGKRDPKALKEYLNAEHLNLELNGLDEINPANIGGWFILKSMVNGLKQNYQARGAKRLDSYFSFLEAHCNMEHQHIVKTSSLNSLTKSQEYIKKWLLIEELNFNNKSDNWIAGYLIKMVMYWSALFEMFIELDFNSDDYMILNKVLPTYFEKQGERYLSPSSERFLLIFKDAWERESYAPKKLTWNSLYSDIVRKQLQDESLTEVPLDTTSPELLAPDIAAIKKRFHRWREGGYFTLQDIKRDLAILRSSYANSANEPRLCFVFFVNMFTLVQKELVTYGVEPEYICKLFAEYPKYKELVGRRYSYFELNAKLKC